MTTSTPHRVLMEQVRRVKDAGGRVKHDKESGVLDAYDSRKRPVIKAIQWGGTKAQWMATYYDTEEMKWGYDAEATESR